MRLPYALVDGLKTKPSKGGVGLCPVCDGELIAKCGDKNVHHWAHKGYRSCDPWWENETDWHREWKSRFPEEWREVVHQDENGERHIADVKTSEDWVLEFQHSYIENQERSSRTNFYPKIIWVVDGLRRKLDKKQFDSALESGLKEYENPEIRRVFMKDSKRLVDEWLMPRGLVVFDFGDMMLWIMLPKLSSRYVFFVAINKEMLTNLLYEKNFDGYVKEVINPIFQAVANFEKKRIEDLAQARAKANARVRKRRLGKSYRI
jgi:hypothetical protein